MNTDLDGYTVCDKHGTKRKMSSKVLSLSIRCRKYRDPNQFANKITITLSSEEQIQEKYAAKTAPTLKN